jgi:hypothetical protein
VPYLAPRAASHLLDVPPHSNLFVGNNWGIGMEGWVAVGRALSSMRNLKKLDIGNYALSFSASFFHPFPQLLRTLSLNSCLKSSRSVEWIERYINVISLWFCFSNTFLSFLPSI